MCVLPVITYGSQTWTMKYGQIDQDTESNGAKNAAYNIKG